MAERGTAVQTALEPTALALTEPAKLFDRINQMHEGIARRAFEIFQSDGGFFGKDLDHWFRAEAELLHPAHIELTESGDSLNVQAEVPGFSADELQVSIDSNRLTISGKRESGKEDKKKGKMVYQEKCSSELLRVVDLPSEVDASKATASLKDGILSLNIPKAAQTKPTRVNVKTA